MARKTRSVPVIPDEGALSIFVDGSSLSGPRRGGVGIRFVYADRLGNETVWDSPQVGVERGTIGQMELLAVITALEEVLGRRFRSEVLGAAEDRRLHGLAVRGEQRDQRDVRLAEATLDDARRTACSERGVVAAARPRTGQAEEAEARRDQVGEGSLGGQPAQQGCGRSCEGVCETAGATPARARNGASEEERAADRGWQCRHARPTSQDTDHQRRLPCDAEDEQVPIRGHVSRERVRREGGHRVLRPTR